MSDLTADNTLRLNPLETGDYQAAKILAMSSEDVRRFVLTTSSHSSLPPIFLQLTS